MIDPLYLCIVLGIFSIFLFTFLMLEIEETNNIMKKYKRKDDELEAYKEYLTLYTYICINNEICTDEIMNEIYNIQYNKNIYHEVIEQMRSYIAVMDNFLLDVNKLVIYYNKLFITCNIKIEDINKFNLEYNNYFEELIIWLLSYDKANNTQIINKIKNNKHILIYFKEIIEEIENEINNEENEEDF